MRTHVTVVCLLVLGAPVGGACGPAADSHLSAPNLGPAAPGADARPTGPVLYRFTIVSAAVDGKMSDGTSWDAESADGLPQANGPMRAYLERYPLLASTIATLGEPVGDEEKVRAAIAGGPPDPMAFAQIGRDVFRTPVASRSFQPLWNFDFVHEVKPRTNEQVQISVVDWDGQARYDVVGTTFLSADALATAGVTSVPPFGNVKEFVIKASVENAAPREVRLVVPAQPRWTETGVRVVAGQTLSVQASGQVCLGEDKTLCSYPDGEASVLRQDTTIPSANRGALVGALGDVRFPVGRELFTTAPASGVLYLGVNDNDHSDNTGSFDAFVRIR